uniref:GAF domain-containing protein n=1 Tax=Peronospora matthiolae TaxID=2874970 RepID=A0AAV1TMS2_9STRA
MSFLKLGHPLDDVNKHQHRDRSNGSPTDVGPATSLSTSNCVGFKARATDLSKPYYLPSDHELLERAQAAHSSIDFDALSAGPEENGPWERVEAADRFVIFRRHASAEVSESRIPGLDVMCAGRLDASIEEVARVLRSRSEVDLASTMQGLYKKNFIFGSLDRDIPCSRKRSEQSDDDSDVDPGEQLNVKTISFTRSSPFARNEQWCFLDFFQIKTERDGFTISQRALPPLEPTPGRVVGIYARVDQLHGLNASILVDQLPNRKGLRVVYNVWFEQVLSSDLLVSGSTRSTSSRSFSRRRSFGLSALSSSSTILASDDETTDSNAQLRRLLSLARGITKLPHLIRRRRFGVQVPVDFDQVQAVNTRCPCCTHSLAPVKMSLFMAASAIAKRKLRSFRMDTRRCYLCGYLVCIDCWQPEYMESTVGRVASIVVCNRCHACVQACDYSEVSAACTSVNSGSRPKVVADQPDESVAPLLTAFLEASLMNDSADASDRAAILLVIRLLLRQSKANSKERSVISDQSDDEEEEESLHGDGVAVKQLEQFLSDERELPVLKSCTLASADRREYLIELPDDPLSMVPCSVIPSHDSDRLKVATDKGLLQLAYHLAPLQSPESFENMCDVRDLDLLCQLAVRATGFSDAFVTVMGVKHNHVLTATDPMFLHTALPREQTICQHTIMTTRPFLVTHPEADVRFQGNQAVHALPIRHYLGFPVIVRASSDTGESETEISIGTLCCTDSSVHADLTRSQYATMKRLSDVASRLIQLKGHQLQQQVVPSTD